MAPYTTEAAPLSSGEASTPIAITSYPHISSHDSVNMLERSACGCYHGCGCGCSACMCKMPRVDVDSTRNQTHGPPPVDEIVGLAAQFASLGTEDSVSPSDRSVKNSYEARAPADVALTRDNLLQLEQSMADTAPYANGQMERYAAEVDEHPFLHFLTPTAETSFILPPPPAPLASSALADEAGMIDATNMDLSSSSLIVNQWHGLENEDSQPMLSSQYEASFPPPPSQNISITGSAVVAGAGTRFNAFALHGPECQHARSRQMCLFCVHY